MKKLLALLLALAVMLCALPALAAEGAADITFEGTVYHLTLERAEIVDGQLNVAVSGFGNSLPMRNGSFIIIAWAAAVVDGEEVEAASVSAGGDGVYTYIYDCDRLPEAVVIYPYEDEDNPVPLWQDPDAGSAPAEAAEPAEEAVEVTAETAEPTEAPAEVAEPAEAPAEVAEPSEEPAEAPAEAEQPAEEPAQEESPEEPLGEPDGSGWSVGGIACFGHYEQDNDADDGAEPIEWIVLAAEGDARLLLSRYGLYPLAYERSAETATWEDCGARAWLNSVFINDAFTDAEQAQIVDSNLENPDNPAYGTDGGNDTTDKVFLLSIDELEKYLPEQADRVADATAYAVANGAYLSAGNGPCWWRLRSPGQDQSHAAIVNASGFSGGVYPNVEVAYMGEDINAADDCMRPAIWVIPGEMPAADPAEAAVEAPAEVPEPVEEPAEEPAEAPAPTIDEILNALGDDACRAAYEALLSGEVVQKGSKGDAAKAVQQTLIALGQPITADGNVGPKTIAALNAAQAAFGLEQTEAVDAGSYAKLLTGQLIATDPDAAEALLSGTSEAAEYDYMRGCVLFAQGRYYGAKQAFEASATGDWEARAAACAQPWPKTGMLYKNPDVKGSNTELTVVFNSDSETAMLVKIYTPDDVLARTLFIGGTGKATVSLPAGHYVIKDGTGSEWYGEEEAFGEEGFYEVMTFADGNREVELKKNYQSTITVNVREPDANADSVGSRYEDWGSF